MKWKKSFPNAKAVASETYDWDNKDDEKTVRYNRRLKRRLEKISKGHLAPDSGLDIRQVLNQLMGGEISYNAKCSINFSISFVLFSE